MRVLVGCEFSGTVRDAFAARGHDAWSCDLLPADGKHIHGDVFEALQQGWDLAIVHPPCTYLCLSGIHWNTRRPERKQLTEDALWLHNLPKLMPTKYVEPRIVTVNGKEYRRWANQTDSGQNREAPSPDRWKVRAKTYEGIAAAMADQWGR